MATRSIENWKQIFAPMAADPMPAIALRILRDLCHYRSDCAYQDDDCESLGNAILAWEQLGKE